MLQSRTTVLLEQALPQLKELRTDLSDLLASHQKLGHRLGGQEFQTNARLRKLETQFIPTEAFKVELARLEVAVKQAALDAPKAAHLDAETLVALVLVKVLERWNSDKEKLLQDLRQQIERSRSAEPQDTQQQGYPVFTNEEFVSKHKETIMARFRIHSAPGYVESSYHHTWQCAQAWVKDTVSQELKDVEGSLAKLANTMDDLAKLPTSGEIVSDARELVQQWIEEQYAKLVPQVLDVVKVLSMPIRGSFVSDGRKNVLCSRTSVITFFSTITGADFARSQRENSQRRRPDFQGP